MSRPRIIVSRPCTIVSCPRIDCVVDFYSIVSRPCLIVSRPRTIVSRPRTIVSRLRIDGVVDFALHRSFPVSHFMGFDAAVFPFQVIIDLDLTFRTHQDSSLRRNFSFPILLPAAIFFSL